MTLQHTISSLPGHAVIEALYALSIDTLALDDAQDADARLRERVDADAYARAQALIGELADSGQEVDAFARAVLARAADDDALRAQTEAAVGQAGQLAFLEGADVLQNALVFGLLLLATSKGSVTIERKRDEKPDGSVSEQRSVKVNVELGAKVRELLKLFGVDGEE
ncbi:hypothetical protein Bsp3421_004269 [Burkholderia sp. FERM BP-3421]|jgi:hypothetical protein|uniref:hypothetical protein n=1 Tax=Burkholderia sp. FERM BP-3421 TaxID=1494466 RepID=UPI00235E869A|nr:hypothetical protein [Burkholderia sp. FERM BP-3421]WDD94155.1 hypothetical protein Bsp3421_004269 [Burkholderia sp. FERM BP-3421]